MVSIAKGLQLEKKRTLLKEQCSTSLTKPSHYFNIRSHVGIKVNLSSSSISHKNYAMPIHGFTATIDPHTLNLYYCNVRFSKLHSRTLCMTLLVMGEQEAALWLTST